jgi:hypothetical protein
MGDRRVSGRRDRTRRRRHVRRLSTHTPLYSSYVLEGVFSEVRIQDPAYPRPKRAEIASFGVAYHATSQSLDTPMDRYAPRRMK